jgi:hypothetical protein
MTHSPNIIFVLFWILILCVGGTGLYNELTTGKCQNRYNSNITYGGQHSGGHGGEQHKSTVYKTHTQKASSIMNKSHILVFIKPSDQDPEFVEKVSDILNHTQFTPPGRPLSLKIADKNTAAVDVTLELGDRETMHNKNKIEYDSENQPIYFSYTYNTTPRKIIFDPGNWLFGVKRSGLTLNDYRDYVVRHEMLHALGYDHQECNEKTAVVVNGEMVCPVMYQSTRGPPAGFVCGSQIQPVDYTKILPW